MNTSTGSTIHADAIQRQALSLSNEKRLKRAQGATRKRDRAQSQAIGRSRGGITTNVLALTDRIWEHDRAFDAGELRQDLAGKNVTPVILPMSNRWFPATYDKHTYKWRYLVENFFGKRKENRGIAMRSCKMDQSVKAFISIAAIIIQPM